ncbi:MAG: T9SS type A sorting domain-containing protein [Bacteroidetes bacterium]|nr:T9SS type A sorting domain-containing protein [Bacteroidota bacterium]
MKKTTLFTLLILFITTFVKAQTAVDDLVLVCPLGSSGGQSYAFPLSNDQVTAGNIDYASIDLESSLPGIQSVTVVNGVTFTADSSGFVTWSGNWIGNILLYYTFSDDIGNTSNVGIIRIYYQPDILVAADDFGNLTPGTVSSQSVLMNDMLADGSQALMADVAAYLDNTYPGFTMSTNGYITIDPSVSPGTYTLGYYVFEESCSFSRSSTVTFSIPDLCWQTFSLGGAQTLAIKTNGTLWAWGNNTEGQLGIGSTINQNTPRQVGTDVDWKFIYSGASTSFAIKNNGTLWGWGRNDTGQLGDGTTVNKNIPTQIGTDSNWAKVSSGPLHTLAIKTDGTLWAWGSNVMGQLGDNTLVDKLSPIQIGTDTNWESCNASKAQFSSARKNNGRLYFWGNGASGQMGNGANGNILVPTLLNGINYTSNYGLGYDCVLALRNFSGTIDSWGWNFHGALGNGTNTDSNVPVALNTDTDWSFVDAGYYFSLGKKTNGTIWTWGYNIFGTVLGNGTSSDTNIPVQIDTATDWDKIYVGYHHVIATKTDGSFWTWGWNQDGQLGNGSNTNANAPIPLSCSTLSINQSESSNQLTVFPNPFEDQIRIESAQNIISIQIFDINGREIFNSFHNEKSIQLNLKSFSSGIYLIRITSNNRSEIHKLIKK